MKASDVMTTVVVSITPGHGVRHAAQIMLDNHVSGLPVVGDDGKVVGILTEGDLLKRIELGGASRLGVDAQDASPSDRARQYIKANSWKAADLMSSPVITAEEDTPIERLAATMERYDIKRLPIVKDGLLTGIVSRADLLRILMISHWQAPLKDDADIRRSVLARIAEVKALQGARLSVIVSGGVVHLWGEVGSQEIGRAAVVVAETVRGVSSVVNHLTLDRANSRPKPMPHIAPASASKPG